MPCIDHSPGKRARPKAGSIQDRIARSHLPNGPETAEELFDWPTFIVKQIAQCPQRIQRLSTFLEHGLRMTSDYAGMDCAAEALTQLEQAMEEVLLRPAGEPKSAFIFNYACDIARLPQGVLKKQQKLRGRGCIFKDILDRLPAAMQKSLQELDPPEDASPEESQQAYEAMFLLLLRNRSWVYSQSATSECLVHGRQCTILPQRGTGNASPGCGPVTLNVAGTICKGWSAVGGQGRFSHGSEKPHAVWLCERIARAQEGSEDMFSRNAPSSTQPTSRFVILARRATMY